MIGRGDALKYVTRCQTSIRHRALPSVIIHLRADGSRAALMMFFRGESFFSHRCNMFSETLRNVKPAAARRNDSSPELSSASMRELLAGSVIARAFRPTHPEHFERFNFPSLSANLPSSSLLLSRKGKLF